MASRSASVWNEGLGRPTGRKGAYARPRLSKAHKCVMAVGANDAVFLPIVSTSVSMVGNDTGKVELLAHLACIDEAVKVHPFATML